VNFIGHATIALWQRSEPAFVLGSMLPDFASMAGGRLQHDAELDASLAHGIALHHRTDDVFHAAGEFTRLTQEALDELTALSVPRGAARAVAHIGVEMLIDGELVRAGEVAEAYVAALHAGAGLRTPFRSEAEEGRWRALRQRLLAFGPPHDYRNVDAVLARLTHVLARRPRLSLDAHAAELVRTRLPALQARVIAALPSLLTELRGALC
jgi:acyl carrier protein phosphodiesterase